MFENLNLATDPLFSYKDFLVISLIILSSLFYIIIFFITKNYWALSSSMKNIILILPITSFIITKVIAGNIALSLGMVGALSIVRFRHPVRSPFELVIYFVLIAQGITYGVSLKWGVVLTTVVGLIILVNYFFKSFISNELENISISITKPMLEIMVNNKIEILENSEFLRSSYVNIEDDKIIYKFEFENRSQLNELERKLENEKNILSISKNL
jgi:hypothetical protein|tara:strand:+ start:92 stop:733 length:642 start_codon:yes stop_codon:yes gene_type:complete